jgi:hypothetical protein
MKPMERGKLQVLFHFLPGKTFDWQDGIAICKVSEIEGKENTSLSKKYILQEVKRLVHGWPQDRRRFFPDLDNEDSYILLEPKRVISEIFPLVFECSHCHRITQFFDTTDFRRQGNTVKCRHCQGTLIQIHHVLIHECGEIAPLSIPSCPTHGRTHIRLDDRASQTYSNFRWVCRACGDRVLNVPLQRTCGCSYNLPKKIMRPVVHRASTAYFPWNVTVVNIPGGNLVELQTDESYPKLLLAAHIQLFDHPTKKIAEFATDQNGLQSEQSLADLERMLMGLPEDRRAMFLSQIDKMKEEIRERGESERKRIINEVDQIRGGHEIAEEAVKELIEFVYARESYKTVTFDKLVSIFSQRYPQELPKIEKYKSETIKMGFSDVQLVENFPIANVMVGYTRLERDKEKSVLRSFPMFNTKQPLYVNSLETEAVIFSLDPIRVLAWLEKNQIELNFSGNRDRKTVSAWFVDNIREVDRFGEINDSSPLTEYVIGLLHTMSHVLIRQAAVLSGFERNSLSEYLFPKMLSFAVYANSLQAATMGGLHSLYEQNFDQWLREALLQGQTCIYDPVCIEKIGACHSCLHLAETSCRHANRVLSRKWLFGGKDDYWGNEIIGYWEKF